MPHPEKIIRSWCLFDWANSAFATTVMAAMLPIFFRRVGCASLSPDEQHLATSFWGYTSAAAMLAVSLLSLLFGPLADHGSSKKRFLAVFTGTGVLSTCLLAFTGSGDWPAIALLFLFGNIGFAGGEVFYDALLPHITPPGGLNRISTRAYAMGYLGGGILLALNIAMVYLLPAATVGHADAVPLLAMRLSFLSAGLWWGFFSIPLFRDVPEPPGEKSSLKGIRLLGVTLRRLKDTFSHIRQYRDLFLFLLAFWFYNDGVGTIIKMATAYGDEIGIGTLDMVGALLLTQAVGIPCSIGFGKLADRIGSKSGILAGLGVYILISVGGFLMTKAWHFWALAGSVGLVQGGTQALSRSLFASLLPKDRSAEFFSFYNISGKFAGILGPAVFGLVGQATGNSRLGILSLLFFFITGGFLLTKVSKASPPD
ncbi:MFS transporter [bacterium]|nr:MFS transporter [bacterium]